MTRLREHFVRARENYHRWSRWGIAIIFLFALFFIAGGGVSQHERWKIEHVDIKGNKVVAQSQILESTKGLLEGNYFFVYSKMNSFLFPKNKIQAFLMDTYPELETVSADRVDSHTISINVTERKQYALWCGEAYLFESPYQRGELNDCYFMDRNGFLFSQAPAFSSGVYFEIYAPLEYKNEATPLGSHVKYDEFNSAKNIYEVFKKDLAEPLRVAIKPEGEVSVILNANDAYPMLSGVEIRTDMKTNATTTVANLQRALPVQFPNGVTSTKKLYYVDMRFGNKIFFGFDS